MADDSVWALGLMSGTSLDGIDAALIRTDGRNVFEFGESITRPLDDEMHADLRNSLHKHQGECDIARIENELTLLHVEVVAELMDKAGLTKKDIHVIGFHGQTIAHRPDEDITWQMGNGALMAEKLGIDVVCDFRRRDVAAGGEGAPLVPLYHASLVKDMELPIAVLNIGGVANVTWIGKSEYSVERLLAHDIIAFDTGPGNGLLDEWMRKHKGLPFDKDGEYSAKGTKHISIIEKYLEQDYFHKHPPKSLDRYDFDLSLLEGLSVEDGAATLAALTAESIALAADHFPAKAKKWVVCGGGRHNNVIMKNLKELLGNVEPVETVSWDGDAFLAVRSLKRLPLTLPTTTGTNHAVTGGAFYPA